MKYLGSSLWVLAAYWISASCASCQTTATLKTAQTLLKLEAGPTSPRLSSLGAGDGYSWLNEASETPINGRTVPIAWKFNPTASHINTKSVAFVYDAASPKLRLTWEWKAPLSTGPIEHTVHIENLGPNEVWLPLQDSFQAEFQVDPKTALKHFYIEKGAGAPSPEGTHKLSLPVGYRWTGTSSTYAHPALFESPEIIPFFAVENLQASGGWYLGIEFSGRTRLNLERDANRLRTVIGLNPDPGPFRTRLQPHETFHTPTIFLGAFRGGPDAFGNLLRPWVRQALTNPRAWQSPQYPLLVNNSWGSGMQVDEPLAQRMIRDSAELGLEMFHLDAGWFRGVGDWYPDPKKFPQGLSALSEAAHRHCLKFGIWADWTQAALDTEPGALNLRDPQVRSWTVSDVAADWKPQPFKGQTIDIGVPAAQAYAQREVSRIVEDYRLDMLEHDGYLIAQGCVRNDHPHAPPDPAHLSIVQQDGASFVTSANSTDVSYHAVRAYYDIYAKLRQRHPNLLLEICNDGGRMVDFGSAAHGDYFSITDSYDPVSNRRAFYDASHVLPPAMLEAYVQKWPTPNIQNFRYMLRSGMMGWLTLMLDTTAWTNEQHAAAKQEINLYKQELRKFIRDADLYHIGPRPDGVHWDAIEYFDPPRQKGVIYVFRGTGSEDRRLFKLQGLAPEKRYQLRFQDHTAPAKTVSGQDLLNPGLTVNLPRPNSSELIFITRAASS